MSEMYAEEQQQQQQQEENGEEMEVRMIVAVGIGACM